MDKEDIVFLGKTEDSTEDKTDLGKKGKDSQCKNCQLMDNFRNKDGSI